MCVRLSERVCMCVRCTFNFHVASLFRSKHFFEFSSRVYSIDYKPVHTVFFKTAYRQLALSFNFYNLLKFFKKYLRQDFFISLRLHICDHQWNCSRILGHLCCHWGLNRKVGGYFNLMAVILCVCVCAVKNFQCNILSSLSDCKMQNMAKNFPSYDTHF